MLHGSPKGFGKVRGYSDSNQIYACFGMAFRHVLVILITLAKKLKEKFNYDENQNKNLYLI